MAKSSIKFAIAVMAAVAAMLASPVLAAPIKAEQQQVKQVFERRGHAVAVYNSEGSKRVYLVVTVNDSFRYRVSFNSCDAKGANCQVIRFYASFEVVTNPSLEQINSYNRGHTFGNAFINESGHPSISFDIFTGPNGIGEADFENHVLVWHSVLTRYSEFVFGKGSVSGKT